MAERPFYPPGVHISSPDAELQEKIRSARKKYRSPISRKRLGTPACYRRRVRTQSEPGERGIAFWAPLERCRSNPSISENLYITDIEGELIDKELELIAREMEREGIYSDSNQKSHFAKIDSIDATLTDSHLESVMVKPHGQPLYVKIPSNVSLHFASVHG